MNNLLIFVSCILGLPVLVLLIFSFIFRGNFEITFTDNKTGKEKKITLFNFLDK